MVKRRRRYVSGTMRPGRRHSHEQRPRMDVELMTYRYEQGRDLWTGRPLTGLDADSWLHVHDAIPEPEPDELELREARYAHQLLVWSISLIVNDS